MALGLLAALGAAACSSSNDDSGSTTDGATADGGGADAGRTAAEYCAEEQKRFDRCLPPLTSAECRRDLPASCREREGIYTESYRAIAAECADKTECTTALSSSSCVTTRLKALAPTAAQQKLADEMCVACAKAPSTREGGLACQGFSFTGEGRNVATGILPLSDTFAEKVRTSCIAPAKQQFPDDYYNCENVFLNCIGEQQPAPASCK